MAVVVVMVIIELVGIKVTVAELKDQLQLQQLSEDYQSFTEDSITNKNKNNRRNKSSLTNTTDNHSVSTRQSDDNSIVNKSVPPNENKNKNRSNKKELLSVVFVRLLLFLRLFLFLLVMLSSVKD